MQITTAIYNAYSHNIKSLLSDIEEQFTLDEHALISITSHFHKLFNAGLSEYGHPMAMMYACTQNHSALTLPDVDFLPAPRSSLACQMVLRQGSVSSHHATFEMLTPNDSTFLALDLGGTNLYLSLSSIIVLSFEDSSGL